MRTRIRFIFLISINLNLWPSKLKPFLDSLIKIQGEYNNDYENEGFCTFCTLCTLHALNALGTLDFQLYFGRPYDTWLPTVLSSVITIFNYIGVDNDAPIFKFKKWQNKNVISYSFSPIWRSTLWTSLEPLFTHYILITYLHKNLHIDNKCVSHWKNHEMNDITSNDPEWPLQAVASSCENEIL